MSLFLLQLSVVYATGVNCVCLSDICKYATDWNFQIPSATQIYVFLIRIFPKQIAI